LEQIENELVKSYRKIERSDIMNIELTLQEKIKDLRVENRLRLEDLAKETGIPQSTLQRIEADDFLRVGYQDLTNLAEYYGVSTDYLFGLTDNRKHRNVEIDALRLSDPAIEALKRDDFNHHLLSELISHPDFPKLMNAMEIYIDRKILPQMNTMNAMYKFAEKTIKDKHDITDTDEMITLLGEAIIDEDEYLRYRITERFNELIKNIYDLHQKDTRPDGETDIVREMKEALQDYVSIESNETKARAKFHMFTKQIGLNTAHLNQDELDVLMKALSKSDKLKRGYRKRKRRQ